MLALSVPPTLPHLLSQVDSMISSSMLPSATIQPLYSQPTNQKPKLSLQTSDLAPTLRPTSCATGANIITTTTPTTLNTFNNTFDLTYRPSPVSALTSPGVHFSRRPSLVASSPISRKTGLPYVLNLPFGGHSILKNSPMPRDVRRASITSSPRIPGRRVFFPAPKKVAFRTHLEDEITNKEFVMRHSDLSSSEDEEPIAEVDDNSNTSSSDEEQQPPRKTPILVDEVSARGRGKRKSVTLSHSSTTKIDLSSNDRFGGTSSSGSKRKRRRWEWTLDSKSAVEPSSEQKAEATHKDDIVGSVVVEACPADARSILQTPAVPDETR